MFFFIYIHKTVVFSWTVEIKKNNVALVCGCVYERDDTDTDTDEIEIYTKKEPYITDLQNIGKKFIYAVWSNIFIKVHPDLETWIIQAFFWHTIHKI